MKRIATFLITLIIMVVSVGCTGKKTVKNAKANLDSSFECTMKMAYDDSEFDGRLRRMEAGVWEAEFDSPESLSGVKLSFFDGDVTASYKGLSFSVPESAIPVKSMLLNLITVVDELAVLSELECLVKDGMMITEGDLDQGSYTLMIDEKTGWISSFEMENNKTKMSFGNMTAYNAEIPQTSAQITMGTTALHSSETAVS